MAIHMLACDFGASSGRVILGGFDGGKVTVEEIHRFPNEPVMMNSTLYWDLPRLFQEMKNGFSKASNAGAKEIDGIGVDTWGVDFGLLDKGGCLLANPVHYRDARTYGVLDEIKKKYDAGRIYMTTGIQMAEFNTLYQLYALRKANDSAYLNAQSLLFMPDLFNYFLTGVMKTELSILSTSQLYDPHKKDWSWDIIDDFDLRKQLFCNIVPSGTKLGPLTENILQETGLKRADVYAVTGHDTACAVVSVPSADIVDTIYLSSGTWSLMGIESDVPYINEKSYRYNFSNEIGYGGTYRVLMNIVGLWIYQECRKEWMKHNDGISFDELEAEAGKCRRFVSFIDPDDHVFFEPGNMPEKIQKFCADTKQKIPETKGEIVATILQSLAMKYRQVADQLDDMRGRKHKTINIIGGGARNCLLSQFTANAVNKTVCAGPEEATSIGNILVQLIAMGELKDIKQAREITCRSFGLKTYEPRDISPWDDAYAEYMRLLRSR